MTIAMLPSASDGAGFIERLLRDSRMRARNSTALGIDSMLGGALHALREECSTPNWDGHGALPVTAAAVRNAHDFLVSLPTSMPRPSVGADPDGDVTLEWYESPRRLVSVSIGGERTVHFAALLGSTKISGSERMYDEPSERLLGLVRQVST